ncbi:MAG: DUF6291 domain-containing protein [Oscillospiraceae bacterium]|nr:DUF6291 domain-containing protein [Oscillospiraceae bacterium]
MRESLVFYKSFYEAIECLPEDEQLKAYKAIMEYSLNGEEPNVDGAAKAIFKLVKPQIDSNNKRYENGKKGAGFGDTGGKPKDEAPSEPQDNPNETPNEPQGDTKATPTEPQDDPTETPNVNANVNANANVNVSDNDSDPVSDNEGESGAAAPAPAEITRHKYGEYGWVTLSDDERERLIRDYGEDIVAYYVKYVDEAAQGTKNKNKWRDWNLVIRKAIRDKWGTYKPPDIPPDVPSNGYDW